MPFSKFQVRLTYLKIIDLYPTLTIKTLNINSSITSTVVTGSYCGQATNLDLQAVCRLFSGVPDIQLTDELIRSSNSHNSTKFGQLSQIRSDFQSKKLDYDRSREGICDFKHKSTLDIPLYHCSLKLYFFPKCPCKEEYFFFGTFDISYLQIRSPVEN